MENIRTAKKIKKIINRKTTDINKNQIEKMDKQQRKWTMKERKKRDDGQTPNRLIFIDTSTDLLYTFFSYFD